MFPQVVDANVHQLAGTSGRIGASDMVITSGEGHRHGLHSKQRVVGNTGFSAGMPGKDAVHIVEFSGSSHVGLHTVGLLTAAAVVANGAGKILLLQIFLQHQSSCQGSASQCAVAATMAIGTARDGMPLRQARFLAQPRQRIILTQQTDDRMACTVRGRKRRGKSAHSTPNRKTLLFQNLRQQFRRPKLPTGKLRKFPELPVCPKCKVLHTGKCFLNPYRGILFFLPGHNHPSFIRSRFTGDTIFSVSIVLCFPQKTILQGNAISRKFPDFFVHATNNPANLCTHFQFGILFRCRSFYILP